MAPSGSPLSFSPSAGPEVTHHAGRVSASQPTLWTPRRVGGCHCSVSGAPWCLPHLTGALVWPPPSPSRPGPLGGQLLLGEVPTPTAPARLSWTPPATGGSCPRPRAPSPGGAFPVTAEKQRSGSPAGLASEGRGAPGAVVTRGGVPQPLPPSGLAPAWPVEGSGHPACPQAALQGAYL